MRMAVASSVGVAIAGLVPPFNPTSAIAHRPHAGGENVLRVDDDPDPDAFELGVARHEVLARR